MLFCVKGGKKEAVEFKIALVNVLLTLAYTMLGVLLCKIKKGTAEHLPTMSGALIYGCTPFLVLNSFMAIDYTPEILVQMGLFFVASAITQGGFLALLYGLLRKKREDAKYRVATLAAIAGNAGFFGIPIVRALLPNHPEVMCYACMYIVAMNVIAFTVGVFFLTGKKEYMTIRAAILNPTMLGLLLALPLFIFGWFDRLPDVVTGGISALSTMTTPLCMIILGIRLSTVSPKQLFGNPMVYLACALKLFIFPLFCYGLALLFPLSHAFRGALLILSATPCASIVLNLAEMHGSETELSANCVLLSTLMCCISIPLLSLLL